MKTLNTLLAILVLASIANNTSAQTSLPVNNATQKIAYHFSVPANGNTSNEALYEMATAWFSKHTKEFTRANTSAPANTNAKNLEEVNHEFDNSNPVQSLDPSSNRITVRVVSKYFGETGGNIRALYVQCYMIVTVAEGKINFDLTDFRYNHFNQNNYKFQRVLNWSNSTSLDAVNTLEYLVSNEQCHAEFNKFYSFMNTDMNRMIERFSTSVKDAGMLTQN